MHLVCLTLSKQNKLNSIWIFFINYLINFVFQSNFDISGSLCTLYIAVIFYFFCFIFCLKSFSVSLYAQCCKVCLTTGEMLKLSYAAPAFSIFVIKLFFQRPFIPAQFFWNMKLNLVNWQLLKFYGIHYSPFCVYNMSS